MGLLFGVPCKCVYSGESLLYYYYYYYYCSGSAPFTL